MRFEKLELQAYGPFTDRTLAFRPDAPLHVVYGPNEAGKTSALSAIGDLLFGFEFSPRYAFGRSYDQLRIGGSLRLRDGRLLTFRRRKANRNTIVDENDSPIGDDLLAPFIGALKREEFYAEFGLKTSDLREGGEALLKAGGKLADTLAASSSGLLALSRLSTRLRTEADGLFTSRRTSGKPFYKALADYEVADKQVRASTVTGSQLVAAQRAVREAEAAREEIAGHYEAAGREGARLRRAQQTIPKLARLEEARHALDACGELPDVAPDILRQWRMQANDSLALAKEMLALDDADTGDRNAIAALHVDDNVLALAGGIAELRDMEAQVRKALEDLPRRREALATERAKLEASARQLGLPDVAALLDRTPTSPDLAQVDEIAEERREAENQLRAVQIHLSQIREGIARLKAQAETAAYPTDPAEARRQLDSLRHIPGETASLRKAMIAHRRERDSIAEEIARLQPAITIDALARMPLPSADAIASAQLESVAITQDIRAISKEADEAARAARLAQEAVQGFTRAMATATPENLREERKRRDEALDLLAQNMDGPAEMRAGHFSQVREASRKADEIADLLLDNAKAIAKAQAATQALAEKQQAQQDIEERSRACVERQADHDRRWRALWAASRLEPDEAAHMSRWRESAANLLLRRERLLDQEQEAKLLSSRLDASRPAIDGLATLLNTSFTAEITIDQMHEQLRLKLEAMQKFWNEGRERAGELRKFENDLEKAIGNLEAAQRRVDEIVLRWPDAIACLGLGANAGLQQALAAVKIWQSVPGNRTAVQIIERSIEGIERDEQTYRAAVLALMAQGVPDQTELKAGEAVSFLQKRLAQAIAMQTERERLKAALAKRQGLREANAMKASRLRAQLQSVCEILNAVEEAEILDAIGRLEDFRKKKEEFEKIRRDLRETTPAHDEKSLRADQEGIDYDALPAQIEAQEQKTKALLEEIQRKQEAVTKTSLALETLSQDNQAADFAQARNSAARDLKDVASDWLVRTAAVALAQIAIERRRERMQDPLVAAASRLFSVATTGAFAGLATGFGKDDQPTLSALRANGEKLAIDALSEGARDQLFLALRLALLEQRAAEPLPFIGDDLLASFDEARAGATLELLADFGVRRQVILFTHHRHITEIARARLGDRLDLIELPA